MHSNVDTILARLAVLANPQAAEAMAHYKVGGKTVYGISIPDLRKIAKEYDNDHALAQELWDSGVHEARILAAFLDIPAAVTEAQMETWAAEFDSWDLCDQVCGNLFDRTPFAYQKAEEWSRCPEEFTKRAAFALMAYLAIHDKKAPDERFEIFLPIICREANDDRNFVKKAVNWALRQIGKRNLHLNQAAITTAREIKEQDSKAARWIAADALHELEGQKVQARLNT